jgi:hypothetical protein
VFSVCCVFTGHCLVTASNAIGCSTSVFTASHPRYLSPISLQLLSRTNWLETKSLTNQLTSLHSTPLHSTPLHSTPLNSTQLPTCPAYNISAQTAQKTPFLCCCAFLACAAISIDHTGNIIPLLLFMGHYLVTGIF